MSLYDREPYIWCDYGDTYICEWTHEGKPKDYVYLLGATFTYVTGRTYDGMCSEWQFICNLGGTAGLSLVPKGQEFFVY